MGILRKRYLARTVFEEGIILVASVSLSLLYLGRQFSGVERLKELSVNLVSLRFVSFRFVSQITVSVALLSV